MVKLQDKSRDDKFVNFYDEKKEDPYHELKFIASQYKNLSWETLRDRELEIKNGCGKESDQLITHKELYEYLESEDCYRILKLSRYDYKWISDHLLPYFIRQHKAYKHWSEDYQNLICDKIKELTPEKIKDLVVKKFGNDKSTNDGPRIVFDPVTHEYIYKSFHKNLCEKLKI